jgi:hypothetical protein
MSRHLGRHCRYSVLAHIINPRYFPKTRAFSTWRSFSQRKASPGPSARDTFLTRLLIGDAAGLVVDDSNSFGIGGGTDSGITTTPPPEVAFGIRAGHLGPEARPGRLYASLKPARDAECV